MIAGNEKPAGHSIGFQSRKILRSLSVAAGALLVVGGGIVLIGWLFDIQSLKSISPDWVRMKVNTAACFILCGLSLLCLSGDGIGSRVRGAGRIFAAVVAFVALLTLVEHLLGSDFGIDQALMPQPPTDADPASPGRMSAATAFSLLLMGVALLWMDSNNRRGYRLALALALVTAVAAILVIAGYLYGVSSPYAFSPLMSMPLPTAVLLFAASLGILCAKSDNGPLGILTAEGIGSTMARRILPLAVILPLLLGWLRLLGERAGYYGFEFGLALFATSNVVVFATLVWIAGVSLNRGDTERVKTEEGLRRSEASLANAQRIANMGNWDLDIKANKLHWSDQIYRIFGIDKAHFEGTYEEFLKRVHPEDRQRLEAAQRAALAGEAPLNIEHRIVLPDGSIKVVHERGDLSRDAQAQPQFLTGTVLDITERRRAEAALIESEERYRRIIELSPDAIFIHQEGRWVFANSASARVLGVEDPSQLVGESPLDYIHPDIHDMVKERWKQLYEEKLPVDAAEMKWIKPDGNIVYLETRAVPVAWKQRPAAQVIARNITERKRTEAALRSYAARLQGMSRQLMEAEETERRSINRELHDRIGQNLSALSLSLNLVRSGISKHSLRDVGPRLDAAQLLLESTTAEVRNVMAGLHPPALDDYGLLAALRTYAESFGANAGLKVAVAGEEPTPRLPPAAEIALFRIAQGAITNAARHAQGTRVGVALSANPGKVTLVVADDGRGFDAASAGAPSGSWGLTIMRERAEAIGATLRIESAPELGTRVTIETPREAT
ncbi:MAG TPA: PAS domain S-box protein [Burkholderiales bacterium]